MIWQVAFSGKVLSNGQAVITGLVLSSPVSSTVQMVVLPLPSSAVMVMLCVVPSPDAMFAPAIGDCVISTDASQLSVAAASATRSGTVIWQVAFSGRSYQWAGGDHRIGIVISGQLHRACGCVAVAVIAVIVMLCVIPSPEAMLVPAIGDCVISTDASQLSVAAASATRFGTVIWQVAFSGKVLSNGQAVITGLVSSSPVSSTVQVVVLPLPSSAVMVMLCVVPSPDAMVVPATGDCVISTDASQLSVAAASATRFGYCDLAGAL